MRVVRHSDVALFSRVAVPLLVPAEAENNVLLGICAGLQAGWTPPRPPYLATVEDDERVVAVAIMTPPRKLLLSGGPHEALEALCTDLVGSGMSVPGTIGATEVADVFATVWQQRTGHDVRLEHRERIYQLTSVISPPPVTGRLRQAGPPDLPIVEPWAHAFVADTGQVDAAVGIAEEVRRAVRAGRLYVWDNEGPVTMAAWAGPTPNGVRVNLVYTPPPLRGRGYASSCVAALSASLLASGRKYCFLFTDLANPTSNSIYTKLGYRPVCDVDEFRFERRTAAG